MKSIDLSDARPTRGIPTRYAGKTFRSQLEARWALFFDKMGVSWKYEPQGFAVVGTDSGGYAYDAFAYLPDFRISYGGEGDYWWLEVKGRPPTPRELHKCECLSLGTGQTVVLVCGGFWDIPRSWILRGTDLEVPPGTETVLRWFEGHELADDEVVQIAEAYRTATEAWFGRAKSRPATRRSGRALKRLVVRLPAHTTS